MEGNVLIAFGLTAFAGLATGIGSLLALLTKHTNKKFLCASLGFSAGVMIYVSFIEIMVKARDALMETQGEVRGTWYAVLAFFGGIPRYLVIDDFPAAVAGADSLNPRLTRGFLEYAQYRGFFADPARPGHVKGVGKLYHWGGARPSRWRRQDQSDASGSAREDGRSRDRQFVLSSRASE